MMPITPPRQDELLPVAEVARRPKLRDRRTVIRLLERSGVAVIKVGRSTRVRTSQLERMLADLERQLPSVRWQRPFAKIR
jgi:hypothetical protein